MDTGAKAKRQAHSRSNEDSRWMATAAEEDRNGRSEPNRAELLRPKTERPRTTLNKRGEGPTSLSLFLRQIAGELLLLLLFEEGRI